MFRTVCDPSSGSIGLYLTEIRSGSLMFIVCLVGVWQRHYEPGVCLRYDGLGTIYMHTHTHTHTFVVLYSIFYLAKTTSC